MDSTMDWAEERHRRSEVAALLTAAKPLIDVGDGQHRVRRIIDAVRDVLYGQFNGDEGLWRRAMRALDAKAGKSFQAWECEDGRTHEDRLAFVDRAIASLTASADIAAHG